jgi:acetoin utilization deacetylase AcuC-like enzyme
MQVYFSDPYNINLPDNHRFPMKKYALLREYLLNKNILSIDELSLSPLCSIEDLLYAHDASYITEIKTGNVNLENFKRIGFPWSPELFIRSCASVGGAKMSALSALTNKISGNLSGGTHHAHRDRGEGFCVFNDVAVVCNYLLQNNLVQKIAIIDLDVHQGNGNSSILGNNPNIFILSLHGEKNYPYTKVPSTLDIALPDFTEDSEYLIALESALQKVMNFNPDFIFYQMGVDGLKQDKLGKLNLSFEGLMKRDRMVLTLAKNKNIPITLNLGGGYADPIELSVEAYANTYRVAKEIYF